MAIFPATGTTTLLLLFAGCAGASSQSLDRVDFLKPDTVYTLARSLSEISGLTVLHDNSLGAVQDEKGLVYVLDPDTGSIIGKHRFASNGDFEALEVVDGRLYVLRSDGRLYTAHLDSAATRGEEDWPSTRSRKLLHEGCDLESLTYDLHSASLWTACKEDPGRGLKRVRGFYRIETLHGGASWTRVFTTNGRSDDSDGFRLKRSEFKPSAMTFLPDGERLLVLSSVKPALLLLNRAGRILETWRLPAAILPQPEGIAIHPDGRLFIASEGSGRRGKLAVYLLDWTSRSTGRAARLGRHSLQMPREAAEDS